MHFVDVWLLWKLDAKEGDYGATSSDIRQSMKYCSQQNKWQRILQLNWAVVDRIIYLLSCSFENLLLKKLKIIFISFYSF